MTWFFAVLIVLALGGVAVVASGYGQGMKPTTPDRRDVMVPAGRDLLGDDLRRVRFTTALRGYRMSEVDALVDRLARQLEDARDVPGGAEDGENTDA
ncbi:DivIVA domain-containing protein [Nocardioides jensenii]|uniref:DivIVA domain-containing protein n=1 Tax=Nocardioides jensenii TaxID=1843 RepID=UPI00082C7172|nr:DivIVA domain-containing protein [Nocardioides jensenii]